MHTLGGYARGLVVSSAAVYIRQLGSFQILGLDNFACLSHMDELSYF